MIIFEEPKLLLVFLEDEDLQRLAVVSYLRKLTVVMGKSNGPFFERDETRLLEFLNIAQWTFHVKSVLTLLVNECVIVAPLVQFHFIECVASL